MRTPVVWKRYVSFILMLVLFCSSIQLVIPGTMAYQTIQSQPMNEYFTNDWWPMFRHDVEHSGLTTASAPVDNDVLWSYQTDYFISSSPAVSHGRVYIGSWDWNVYCFAMDSGALLWNYTTTGEITSSPAVVNGKLYVGSGDTKLYCLDAITGSFVWDFDTNYIIESSPTVVENKVFFSSNDGSLYCLNADDGFLLWRYDTDNVILSSPAVADGKVYCGTIGGLYFCLDYSTGDVIWTCTLGEGTYSSPTLAEGKMFIGSNDYQVYCFDATNGATLWNYSAHSEVHSSPAVAYGYMYIGTSEGLLLCLQEDTGGFVWSYQINGAVAASPAVSDGKVYFGSDPCCGFSSFFYCLDAYTGALVWQYNFNTQFQMKSSAAIAAGKVFVGSAEGKVYAFGDSEYLADANGPYYEAINTSLLFTGSVYGGQPGFSWYWTFGDGSTSTEQNPSHTYTILGTYPVSLVVTDSLGAIATDDTVAVIQPPNQPPDAPVVDGPTTGQPNVSCSFSVDISDPDSDTLFYFIDWGDNTTTGWRGPFLSGTELTENHTWSNKGSYLLNVKTKDAHGAESPWSSFAITIRAPELSLDLKGGLGLTMTITNTGNGPATNVTWSISFHGGFVFPPLQSGTLLTILPGEQFQVKVVVIGFGKLTLTASAVCDEGASVSTSSNATLLLVFVFGVK